MSLQDSDKNSQSTTLNFTGNPKNDDFEWDDAKAASNRRHHKITFEQARDAFADPFIGKWIDEGQYKNEQH